MKRPSRPQINASASPRWSASAPMTLGDERTTMRATSGVTPLRSGDLEIGRDVVAIARIVVRIDDLEIDVRMDCQAETLDAVPDHVGPPDQDRPGDSLLQHNLRRPQHALVLALGVDYASFSPRAPWRTPVS